MGEVHNLNLITSQRVNPDRVLEACPEYGLTDVVILGFDKDGEFYFASSLAGTGDILYLFEKARHELLKMEDHIAETGDPRGKK